MRSPVHAPFFMRAPNPTARHTTGKQTREDEKNPVADKPGDGMGADLARAPADLSAGASPGPATEAHG